MKTKKLLSIISAAAMTVTALSGSMLTVNAEDQNYGTAEMMPGGGTRLTIVSNDSVTHGSGGIKVETGLLESTHVDGSDKYLEITLPALDTMSQDGIENYDKVSLNIGVRDDNPVNIQVRIGDKVVAEASNINTGKDWNIVPFVLSLNENYSSADYSQNVVLHVTEAEYSGGNRGSYCGNYESVEFYNEGDEAEADIASKAKPICSVVKAREITRTDSADRFGKLSNMAVTSQENYPSVFGEITNYTECCDFTSGDDYYYVSVAETGNYSFAVLAEGNALTDLKIEKVNGTNLESVEEYSKISWTAAGSCYYVGSNGSTDNRTLYTHTTPEIELTQGLYKVTFSPAAGGTGYYCDLIAIAGISASAPEEAPEFVIDSENLGVAEGTGDNENTYATMFGIKVTNNGADGAFSKVISSVTSNNTENTSDNTRSFEADIKTNISLEKGASIVIGAIIDGLNDAAATMTTTVE